ncbi:hypothetical protein CPC08DRAFT_712737 [Agrocybe pediades]|nr:hypothetical protein CPC08DRAFT_712737 [Agrocybe pediades]
MPSSYTPNALIVPFGLLSYRNATVMPSDFTSFGRKACVEATSSCVNAFTQALTSVRDPPLHLDRRPISFPKSIYCQLRLRPISATIFFIDHIIAPIPNIRRHDQFSGSVKILVIKFQKRLTFRRKSASKYKDIVGRNS